MVWVSGAEGAVMGAHAPRGVNQAALWGCGATGAHLFTLLAGLRALQDEQQGAPH
jgi:hypothetical protein